MATNAATELDFHVFDTTLRDGAQREGISYSVADKLAVARLLDELGVGFIEGGWPGAMPKDTEFFARAAAGELKLRHAVLVLALTTAFALVVLDPRLRSLFEMQALSLVDYVVLAFVAAIWGVVLRTIWRWRPAWQRWLKSMILTCSMCTMPFPIR